LALALPAALALAADPLLGMVDTALIGRLGADELVSVLQPQHIALMQHCLYAWCFVSTLHTLRTRVPCFAACMWWTPTCWVWLAQQWPHDHYVAEE
jgi:hypothetical protein